MRNFASLTATRILSTNTPEAVFSRDPLLAKREYRALVRCWHPDFCSKKSAAKVLEHILDLYKLAKLKIEDGSWCEPYEKLEQESPGLKKLRLDDGQVFSFQYQTVRLTDTGCMYISPHSVLFEVQDEFAQLFAIGRKNIYGLTFADVEMAAEASRYLPEIIDSFSTGSNHYLCVRKTPDQLLLADVLEHMGGKIQPIEHIGWILNCLYNLCCFLEWSNLTHNAISVNNIFVSPLRHDLMLLGGWWFSRRAGEDLIAVPTASMSSIPSDIIESKIAESRADLELVKSVGRTLIGDRARLRIPTCIRDWLREPAASSAIGEYRTFKYEVLEQAFGLPKFVELNLSSSDLYNDFSECKEV